MRQVGAFALKATSSVFHPGHTTVGLSLTDSAEASAGRRWRACAKVENASDRLYATRSGLGGGEQTFDVGGPLGLRVGLQFDL